MDEAAFRPIQLEYQQASALFLRGFDLIFNLVRGYLYFNAITIGIVGIGLRTGSGRAIMPAVVFFAVIGILAGGMSIIVHIRMTSYLRMWLERASEIERQFGGDLFTRTHAAEVSGRKRILQSYSVSLFLYILFAAGWAILLLVTLTGNIPP